MNAISQAVFLAHLVDNRLSGFGLFAESSLTMSDWCALRVLIEREHAGAKTNVSKLADLLGVSRQRGKQVIDNLVAGGFATAAESAEVARIRFAAVTEKGARAAAAIDGKIEGRLRDGLTGKSARAEGLVKLLKRIEAAARRAQPKVRRADRKGSSGNGQRALGRSAKQKPAAAPKKPRRRPAQAGSAERRPGAAA